MTRHMTMLLATLGVALTLLVTTTVPAWAHISLVSSSPGQGTSINALPDAVSVSFSGDLQPLAEVVVLAASGEDVASGTAQVSGSTVTQAVQPGTAPGQYALAYRVTSDDDHVITGRVTFAVGVPYDGTPPQASAREDASPPEASSQPTSSVTAFDAGLGSRWAARDIVVPIVLLIVAMAAWVGGRRLPDPRPHAGGRRE